MFSTTIKIPKAQAREAQRILDEPELENYKNADVIQTWSANFGDGIEADIKLVNGDTPYIDAVLFQDGCEVNVLDVSETLLGEYDFRYKGMQYVVNVEVV
jgi:hypothetical protein